MTMEAEKYVRRVPRRDDGRYVDVLLTEKRRALFDSLDTVVRQRQNRLLKGFSPRETEAAFGIMRRLIKEPVGVSSRARPIAPDSSSTRT